MSEPVTQRLKVSREGIVLIKSFEGFRPRALPREDGGWIIGYGHTLSAREGASVSEADAELLLQYDLLKVAEAVGASVTTPLNQHQFDALASFALSVGIDRFQSSDVLQRLNAGAAGEAADAMVGWPEPALPETALRRRAAERALFVADPDYPVALSDLLSAPLPPPPVETVEPVVAETPYTRPDVQLDPVAEIAAEPEDQAEAETETEVKPAAVAEVEPAPVQDAVLIPVFGTSVPTTLAVVGPVSDSVTEAPVAEFVDVAPAADVEVAPELASAPSPDMGPAPIEAVVEAAPADAVTEAVPIVEDAAVEPVLPATPVVEAVTPAFAEPILLDAEIAANDTVPEATAALSSASVSADAVVEPFSATLSMQPYSGFAGSAAGGAASAFDAFPAHDEVDALGPIGTPGLTLDTLAQGGTGELLVLTPLVETDILPSDRPAWDADQRTTGDFGQTPLFEDVTNMHLRSLGPTLLTEQPEEPRRFQWGETVLFLIMGAFGLVCFGMAMAAFRLASQQVNHSDQTGMIGWVLALIGVACVGVSAYNLYRRLGRADA